MRNVRLENGSLAMYFTEIKSGQCIASALALTHGGWSIHAGDAGTFSKSKGRFPIDVCLGGRRETVDEVCSRFGLNITEEVCV